MKGTIFTAKGLQPDVGYEFRVTAENKAGPGAPSSPSSPIKYEEQINFLRELQDVKVRTESNYCIMCNEIKISKILCVADVTALFQQKKSFNNTSVFKLLAFNTLEPLFCDHL